MAANQNGVTFSRRPSQEQMKRKLDLIRVPASGIPLRVILSHDVLGCDTHYAKGRTRPCPGENCEQCEKGEAPRWRGYLMVATKDLEEIQVLEVTPAVMPKLDAHFREHRSLRGAGINLERKNGKANGELWCRIAAKPKQAPALPKAPRLENFLNAMWGLKQKAGTDKATEPPRIYPADEGPDFGEQKVG